MIGHIYDLVLSCPFLKISFFASVSRARPVKTSFFVEWGIAQFNHWREIECLPRHCTVVHTNWTTDIVPSYSSIVQEDILKYVFQQLLFQNYFHIYRLPAATKVQFKNRLDPYDDTLLKTNRTGGHIERLRQTVSEGVLGSSFSLFLTEKTNQLLVKDQD